MYVCTYVHIYICFTYVHIRKLVFVYVHIRTVRNLDDIITMVVPRQSYLKYIDPDGTRPFEEVKAEVKTMASRYYHLVKVKATSAKHRAEVARGLISTLDVYEAFHYITRQSGWAAEDERVKLSDEEGGGGGGGGGGGEGEGGRGGQASTDSSVVYMQVALQVNGM